MAFHAPQKRYPFDACFVEKQMSTFVGMQCIVYEIMHSVYEYSSRLTYKLSNKVSDYVIMLSGSCMHASVELFHIHGNKDTNHLCMTPPPPLKNKAL